MFIVQPTTSTNDISRRRSSVRAMKLKRCNKYIIFLTSIKMCSKSCRNHLWTYYIVLYETFWNFINTVTRDGYCDYVEKVWNKSENLHKSYEIFSVGTYFVKIMKIFKQSIAHYINEPRYSVGPFSTLLACLRCSRTILTFY